MDAWTASALTGDGGQLVRRSMPPIAARPLDVAKALPAPVTPPTFTLTPLSDGRQQLTVTPAAGSRAVSLSLRGTASLTGLTVNGRPAQGLETAGKSLNIRWQAAPQGLTLAFRPAGPGELSVTWAGLTEQWPVSARRLPVRPASAMAWDYSDSTLVRGQSRFHW
jgi:hypothetical protein